MNRREWNTVFDLMEDWRAEHPDATDEEAFEAVCQYTSDRIAYRIEQMKERNRERLSPHA